MPQLDGFEFLVAFERMSEEQKEKCSIIMLSSFLNVEDIESAEKNPYVLEYVIKLLDSSKLNNVLKMIS